MTVDEDTEGRCLSCVWCKGGGDFNSYHCRHPDGPKGWMFSVRYDGLGCKYYEYDR